MQENFIVPLVLQCGVQLCFRNFFIFKKSAPVGGDRGGDHDIGLLGVTSDRRGKQSEAEVFYMVFT